MPIYEDEEITRDKLEEIRKRNVCAVCGEWLNMFLDAESGKAFVACHEWLRSGHQGIERERSRWEKEGLASLNIKTRREIMEQEHGTGMTTAMEKSRLPMTGALTQPQAMDILKLVYPKAPEDQIIRAAIFCRDFGLHPLAREVFLIPFNEGKPNESWAMVVGIPANRKMAYAVKGEFSFLDDTPRAASDAEVIKQYGKDSDEAKSNLISVTKLSGVSGNLAIGFGLWPRNETPKGTDKGNTKRNMANHRSERQAMDRLPGPSLPKVEVVDERYVEVPDVGKVDKATGEIIEGEAVEVVNQPSPPLPEPTHWCQEHNCAFTKKTKFGKEYWSHPLPDGKWCNEGKKKDTAPKAEPYIPKNTGVLPSDEPETELEPIATEWEPEPEEPSPNTIEALKETMDLCNWSAMAVGQFCAKVKFWTIREYKDLSPEQIAELIQHIKQNPN